MSEKPVYLYNKVEHALARQAGNAQARVDAFTFAVKCNASIVAIETEIKERETLIAELLADFPLNGPMSPGAGPRVYRDAYIAGLRDAIALIREMGDSG